MTFVHKGIQQGFSPDTAFYIQHAPHVRSLKQIDPTDLARSEEERIERERTMQRVNAAFQGRDLAALRSLTRESEFSDPAFEAKSIGEKLVWAIREVARLDDLIAAIEVDLAAIRATDTYALWQRQRDGEPVIENLSADISSELSRKRDLLAELIATYRQTVESRQA
jgi:hypothetical protein